MTRPRWAFTVISLIPSSAAICLFNRPETTNAMVSRSRGVSDACESRSARNSRLASKRSAAALDRLPDGRQQHLIAEWLGQELHCPSLHRLHRGRHVAITGDEDDRHIRPIDDALLEIETIEVGKCHVENQAARTVDARTFEELLRRREGLGLPAAGENQQLQRFPHRYIVVNNEHNRGGARQSLVRSCSRRASPGELMSPSGNPTKRGR